jgi:hypothetical protein
MITPEERKQDKTLCTGQKSLRGQAETNRGGKVLSNATAKVANYSLRYVVGYT